MYLRVDMFSIECLTRFACPAYVSFRILSRSSFGFVWTTRHAKARRAMAMSSLTRPSWQMLASLMNAQGLRYGYL